MFNMSAPCVNNSFKTRVFEVEVTKPAVRKQGDVFTNLFPCVRWTPALCGTTPSRWLQEAPEGTATHL